MSKLLIGTVSYNDLDLLKETIPALEKIREKYRACAVVVDNAWSDEVKYFFESKYPNFQYVRFQQGNVGYGKAFNEILSRYGGSDFFLVHTSDVLLDEEGFEQVFAHMQNEKKIAQCAGKLYQWEGNKIDSLGISAKKYHHFYDLGHGEEDKGQYDGSLDKVFGISGAAFLIRTEVVQEKLGGKLFDPRFFMYKEDIDLAYKLRWLGEEIKVFPLMWGRHKRTATKGSDKSDFVITQSYKNHLLMMKNNFSFRFPFYVIFSTFVYEFLKAFYVFFRLPKAYFNGLIALFAVKSSKALRIAQEKDIIKYFQ